MSNTNLLGSEEWAVVGQIDPVSQGAGTVYSDNIDMSLFEQIIVLGQFGALGTAATADLGIASAATTNPTTLISGKSGTQLVDSPADNDNNKQIVINLRGDELTEGHRYVRAVLTVATAASLASVTVLGKGKSLPASDNDLASVAEIVS
jgi:hypothetical protein